MLLGSFMEGFQNAQQQMMQMQNNRIQQESNQLQLQNQKMQMARQQEMFGRLKQLHDEAKTPVGMDLTKSEADNLMDQSNELLQEAKIKADGGDDVGARASLAAAHQARADAIRMRKQDMEEASSAVYGVHDQGTYDAALAAIQEKLPDIYAKMQKIGEKGNIDITRYNDATHGLLNSLNSTWKAQAAKAKQEHEVAKLEEKRQADLAKANTDLIKAQTGVARIQLGREGLQFRKEQADVRKQERAEKDAEKAKKEKEAAAAKAAQAQAASLAKFKADTLTMNQNFAKEWQQLENLKSTKKITSEAEYKRRADELDKDQMRRARALATLIRQAGFSVIDKPSGQAAGGLIKQTAAAKEAEGLGF